MSNPPKTMAEFEVLLNEKAAKFVAPLVALADTAYDECIKSGFTPEQSALICTKLFGGGLSDGTGRLTFLPPTSRKPS